MIEYRHILTALFAMILAPAQGLAQSTPVSIPDAPTCASCRITLTPLLTLGEMDGPGSFSWAPYLSVDRQGRFWMYGGKDDGGGPAIFRPDGRYLQEVGRRGQGPGEYERTAAVVHLPGDSVLIVDGNSRGTVLGPDLTPVRYLRFPVGLSSVQLIRWPGALTAFSHYASGIRGGGPTLHLFAADSQAARVTASFGPEWSMRDMETMEGTVQTTSIGRSGIWSGLMKQYRISLWSLAGQPLKTIDRKPEWFAGVSTSLWSRDLPPGPKFTAIHEDNEGRLWTFVAVAAPTWREGWPKGNDTELRAAAFDYDKMYRTIIEVIDPVVGRVIARRQLDEWIVGVLPDGRAMVNFTDRDDVRRIRIVRLALEGQR